MGRPIKKKFFGNLNRDYYGSVVLGSGVGGEGVATITKNNTGTSYTTSTTLSLSFTAPQIAGGVAASGSVTTNALGNVATVTLTDGGSGYTSAPTATVTGGGGSNASFVVTLTSNVTNAIAFNSYLTTGTQVVSGGDIVKQESSRRYLVNNSEGEGQCKLVSTSSLTAGTMNIVATDWNGSTYYVKKLTARKAVLVQTTASTAFLVADGAATGWTLNGATGTTVTIAHTI